MLYYCHVYIKSYHRYDRYDNRIFRTESSERMADPGPARSISEPMNTLHQRNETQINICRLRVIS